MDVLFVTKWKIFIYLYLFLLFIPVILQSVSKWDVGLNPVETLGFILAAIPIYGCAYRKRIGWRGLAKLIFFFNAIVFAISVLWGTFVLLVLQPLDIWMLALILAAVIVNILLLVPQYSYAYKFSEIWSSDV